MSIVALCGGIGGAKLALGLYHALPADKLTIIGNTGDDFEHLGLSISPDLDTICYTLGGLADRERGWGRAGESWNFMEAVRELGGPDWFSLGDRDLALHVMRSEALRAGSSLTEVTAGFAKAFGIAAAILPMSDDPVRTMLDTSEGPLAFQDYFVRLRCTPQIHALRYQGAEAARPSARALLALADPSLEAVIICPSNPYLSIDPILAVPGLRDALRASQAPVVAVSPLIGGKAVKGPTAEIMQSLGIPATQQAICDHYGDLLDALVLDEVDAGIGRNLSIPWAATATLMTTLEDRFALARFVLAFAQRIGGH